MPRNRHDVPITLSVLDRLIDDDIRKFGELHLTRSQSMRKLRDAVRRDLEWLLNTRQPVSPAAQGTEVYDSLYMYGLPDITSIGVRSIRDRQALTQVIQATVSKFEPRIANVRVSLVSGTEEKTPSLHFVIEGLLRVYPDPEHVSFNGTLELSSGEYKVRGEAGAR